MLTNEWKKSSRSGNTGGNCVELRLTNEWKKSSRSGNTGGDCVEARALPEVVQVRDTKLGESSPILNVDTETFAALLADLKNR